MVDADQPPVDLRAAHVVDSEVGAALVLELEPAEALRLARLLVARELEEGGLAELAEDGDHVAFRELVGQAAEVDEGRVAVVDVPGGVGAAAGGRVGQLWLLALEGWSALGGDSHSMLDLLLVQLLYGAYLVHSGGCGVVRTEAAYDGVGR